MPDDSTGGGSTLTITGGNVIVSKGLGSTGPLIGGGSDAPGTLKNSAGNDVFLTEVALDGVNLETEISSISTDAGYTYGTTDMRTDAAGKLYLYLPEGANTISVVTSPANPAYTGEVTTTTDPATSLGTLSIDTVAPTVSSVSPDGTCAPFSSGSIAINFSERMRPGSGTVSLSPNGVDFTVLAGGSWSAGNTVYTASYSGLQYDTQYTVKVEGFQDFHLNMIAADTSHSFTAANNDASLSGLSISRVTLSPGFACDAYVYTASVENGVSSLTVTPTTNDAQASVMVNGKTVASGTVSGDIALATGANTITITVTAQDGTTTQNYTITVTRAAYYPPPWYSVTGVTLDKSSLSLQVDDPPVKLTAAVEPSYASYPYCIWSSSDSNAASVDAYGLVTPLSPGQAVITVTTADGGKTASCSVQVLAAVTGVNLNKTGLILTPGQR